MLIAGTFFVGITLSYLRQGQGADVRAVEGGSGMSWFVAAQAVE